MSARRCYLCFDEAVGERNGTPRCVEHGGVPPAPRAPDTEPCPPPAPDTLPSLDIEAYDWITRPADVGMAIPTPSDAIAEFMMWAQARHSLQDRS